MDLVGHFNSLNLKNPSPRREFDRDRPRSPLRPATPTLKRFFSPERPPSPRPVAPRGASNICKFETTPKRRRFCQRGVRKAAVRRLLFESSSSSATELMDTIDGINNHQPRMTSSPLPAAPSAHRIHSFSASESSVSNFAQNSTGDSAVFDLSLNSTFQFVSTTTRTVQTDEQVVLQNNGRYLIDVDPDLIFSSVAQAQTIANTSQGQNYSSLPASSSSSSFYKSRLRRTSRSWQLPVFKSDASVQVEDDFPAQPSPQRDVIEIEEEEEEPAPRLVVRNNQTLLAALECPVCYNHCLPPVTQCRWGHIICNQCLPQLGQLACPVCRTSGPGAFVRSIALDSIANELTFPCRYLDAGCTLRSLSPAEKMAHELACPFRFLTRS